jgi:hypothetical protein
MKTANWRVKFMMSWRGTFFLVISNFMRLCLFSTSGAGARGEQRDVGRARRRGHLGAGDLLAGLVVERLYLNLKRVFFFDGLTLRVFGFCS